MKESDKYPRKVYHHLFSRKYIGAYDKLCKQFPYQSIEMERTPSLGNSPIYKIVLFRNGTAIYEGIRNVEYIGLYEGVSSVGEFGKLSYLIEELGIENLKDEYRYPATDQSSTYLRINRADGSQKEIRDYGNVGPIKLWAVQQVIDNFISTIVWKPIKDNKIKKP